IRGAVTDIAADPTYLDVSMPPSGSYTHPIPLGHTAFVYLFEGEALFGITSENDGTTARAPRMLILGDGDALTVRSGLEAARFLIVSGKPLNEPIARYGPFVMNTEEEIEQTLRELRDGTFIR